MSFTPFLSRVAHLHAERKARKCFLLIKLYVTTVLSGKTTCYSHCGPPRIFKCILTFPRQISNRDTSKAFPSSLSCYPEQMWISDALLPRSQSVAE